MKKNCDVLLLHVAVMLLSLSGVVAKHVTVTAVAVAAGRVLISTPTIFLITRIKRESVRLGTKKDYLILLLAGVGLGVHWTAFFQSIKLASVAIGTITFSAFPLFVTFLEPILYREKLRIRRIVSAVILLLGVWITIPELSMGNTVTVAIVWGMLSAFTYALITLANRYFAQKYSPRVVCLYEQGTAAFVLLPVLLLGGITWSGQDIAGILLIGMVCTALAHSLYVTAQRRLLAQTAGIISGMETVYGIVYALLLLGEIPTLRELIGGAVILGVAMITTLCEEPL